MARRYYWLLAASVILTLLVATSPVLAVPRLINYQGKLTDSGGNPLDGTFSMRFRLYKVQSGGSALWAETQSVEVAEGIYSVQLGARRALTKSVFANNRLYLEVAVDGETLSPRQRLTSTAFSMKAGDADTLGGLSPSEFASSSHSHWGTSWSGSGVGLYLNSSSNDGLRVSGGFHGVNVESAGEYGMYVSSAGSHGVAVGAAGNHGVRVTSAGQDGAHVFRAGNPSTTNVSSEKNGFEVAGAEGHGLYVGQADKRGVYVESAGDDGVYVESVGSPSTTLEGYIFKNGFEVAGAEGHGLHVGRADKSAVYVSSADDGFHVMSADDDGVYVKSAGDDGVHVESVGSPSSTLDTYGSNGFEVEGAERNGLAVGRADENGVYVQSAGINGVYVKSADDVGVYVKSAVNFAGYFTGRVHVQGPFSKASGGFRIDHPLDPEQKYLNHSFVESPDMKNIYDGTVRLDENGEAWVELPDWFEALNKDFRYQLTCIGGFAQVYIAKELSNNRFKIAGGSPKMKVSWQVTGIRQDPWADANRILVEEDKPDKERGYYLDPELYGKVKEMSIEWARNSEMKRQIKEDKEISEESREPSEG